jgi:tRNA (guanine10-N2)-methyltransferase
MGTEGTPLSEADFAEIYPVYVTTFQLITIRKSTSLAYPPPTFDSQTARGGSGSKRNDHDAEDASPASLVHAHIPAHRDFREKYFQGFKNQKTSSEASST